MRCMDSLHVALVVPCYNEALTIAAVIEEFKAAVPTISVHVFDNNSTDETAAVARAAGATVHLVRAQGKGSVVRRMFADVDADLYVMVDGDATYSAANLKSHLTQMVDERIDMLIGVRASTPGKSGQYRTGHRLGNLLLTRTAMWVFGGAFEDMLSGYRIFSRRYAKSFPARSKGFETETELTVHALEMSMPCAEVPVEYRARPEGSQSKLSTWRDGVRILRTIVRLLFTERPLLVFGSLAFALSIAAVLIAIPVIRDYLATGLVLRLPTAVLATGLVLSGLLSGVCAVLLDQLTIARSELKHLAYLHLADAPSPHTG